MMDLMKQMEMFTEHVTEAGTVAYYAPGEELDCLPRALMMCCFAARNSLEHGVMPLIIKQGGPEDETAEQSFHNYFKQTLGDDYDGLDESHLNTTSKFNIFNRTKRKF